MRVRKTLLVLILSGLVCMNSGEIDAFVAEATEIIAVVRIGVSLVEYTYKVFRDIFEDSGLSDTDLTGLGTTF